MFSNNYVTIEQFNFFNFHKVIQEAQEAASKSPPVTTIFMTFRQWFCYRQAILFPDPKKPKGSRRPPRLKVKHGR